MKAVFAGSFDPFTGGHLEIVKSAKTVFSELTVAVAADTGRKTVADIKKRIAIAQISLVGIAGVTVKPFSGLLTDFLARESCVHLVRGLRDSSDFLCEQSLLSVYQSQLPQLNLIYFCSSHPFRHVSGTAVRELTRLGGNLDGFVEKQVQNLIRETYGK